MLFLMIKIYKMKKIGKLSINPEKVIKNEELVNLKGGYLFMCTCTGESEGWFVNVNSTPELVAALWNGCEYGGNCDPY